MIYLHRAQQHPFGDFAMLSKPAAVHDLIAGLADVKHDTIYRDFTNPYLELIRLLHETAEIEHALMVQYLYSAFSVRMDKYAGIVGGASMFGDGLLVVAVQEMDHLDTVNRWLVKLGAAPNLTSQQFPYQTDLYPFPMDLVRMSRSSLAKYTYTEAPAEAVTPGPDNPDSAFATAVMQELGNKPANHVGSVYRAILAIVDEAVAKPPFTLPDLKPLQDDMNRILHQGEAGHFPFFKSLFLGTHPGFNQVANVWELAPDNADYPSLPIMENPSAIPNDAASQKWPTDQVRRLGMLANLHYWAILLLLDLNYRFGDAVYMSAAKSHMVRALQTIGRGLAAMGAGAPFDPLSMGYAPGPDERSSRRYLILLLGEALRLETDLAAILPAGYPAQLTAATQNTLRQMGM
jgi:hypothetical protein